MSQKRETISGSAPEGLLGRLCRYYLNCLHDEDVRQNGSCASYLELGGVDAASLRSPLATLFLARMKQGQCAWLGYPLLLRHGEAGEADRLIPLMMVCVDENGTAEDCACLNPRVLARYQKKELDKRLEDEAELNGALCGTDIGCLALQLKRLRPDWEWREEICPNRIDTRMPLEAITQEGIYNRAALLLYDRPRHTRLLEEELAALSRVTESVYKNTALARLLFGTSPELRNAPPDLLMPLPLDAEQERAVTAAMTEELTLVTGAPGTGKTRVADSALINQSWYGRRALLAHTGGGEKTGRARFWTALAFQEEWTPERRRSELSEYRARLSRRNALQARREAALDLASRLGALEGRMEALSAEERALKGGVCEADAEIYRMTLEEWEDSLAATSRELQPPLGRFFWPLLAGKRKRRFEKASKRLNRVLTRYHMEPLTEEVPNAVCDHSPSSARLWRVYDTLSVAAEERALEKQLSQAEPPEVLDPQILSVNAALTESGERLWQDWLSTARERPCVEVSARSISENVALEACGFDLLVLDGANQCGIAAALPLLFRTRRALVLGDPNQLRPVTDLSLERDAALLDAYGLDSRWSYTAGSVCDWVASAAPLRVELLDYHRGAEEIVAFSNRMLYGNRVRIATDERAFNVPTGERPGVRWLDVNGQTLRPSGGGAYNPQEAEAALGELRRLTLNDAYHGSVAVLTLFQEQAVRLREAVAADAALAQRLEENNFSIETVQRFQGGERDVILLSLVVSYGASSGVLHFLQEAVGLLNAAVTRAKALLIVLGNLSYCTEAPVAFLSGYAAYGKALGQRNEMPVLTAPGLTREYPSVDNPGQVSGWEKFFYTALFDAGIHTIPQYPIGRYRLDLALIVGRRRLDIEVDGAAYHLTDDGERCRKDQIRNGYLYARGWDVRRFWVSQIRDSLPWCVAQIRAWMDEPKEGAAMRTE